jgi:prepilin-type N-terminal cleavage/methylation domain-containing protein
MNTRKRSSQSGFTLTEILVAVAVFAIVMVATLMIYDRSNRIFKTSVENAEMQQNTRAAFDRVVADVRMAGFDYDRDGIPVRAATAPWQSLTNYAAGAIVNRVSGGSGTFEVITAGQSANLEPSWPPNAGDTIMDASVQWRRLGPVYQQPDEQIEFAGRSAITIRGNFDFSTDVTNEHGRETAYEPLTGQFPIVTTANEEIVTYALRRVNGASPDTLTFYADVARPRATYPGGSAETLVSIPNVDLCASGCNNPPYTLMRFQIQPNGQPDAGTPVATSIRDLRFNYFTDSGGQTLLTDADGNAITQGAVGGLGQYDPANIAGTANWDDRTQRSRIQSVRVGLTGMAEAPDRAYTNPAEGTSSPARQYRTYSLESNVKPRNLGLSGFAEPNTQRPGPPTITSVCVGSCNLTRVTWTPPASSNVAQYEVRWDTTSTGNFTNIGVVVPGDVVSAPVFGLNPGTLYFFKVLAINENGVSDLASTTSLSRSPVNSTRPSPVTDLAATDGAAAEANQIRLSWTVPATNDPALANLSCAGTSMSGSELDPAEPIRFRIWRGTTANFNPMASPSEGQIVLDSTVAPQPTGTPGLPITWVDDATNLLAVPPANCKDYYYRIQVYDTCSLSLANPATNNPNSMDTGRSSLYPAATSSSAQPAIHGYASSSSTPAAPGQPTIVYLNGNSTCNRGANTCDVKILWPRVTAEMSNPTQNITIDQYRIRRERKKFVDTTWALDTILPIVDNASTDPSRLEGTNVVFHDTTAIDHDQLDKRKWYYRYTVTALQCSEESAASPPVQFPAECGLARSTVIESGARSGNGSAAAPWVMNATDYIQVQDDLGLNLASVEFEVYPEPDPNPNNRPLDSSNVNRAPFVYFWNDRADGANYRVVITMTNNAGCTEQTERFIQDDPISCPSATITQTGASAGSGVTASPWVMGAGDLVTVNQPAGVTISSVTFSLFNNATLIGAPVVDSAAPFQYTWSNQIDNTEYRLVADIVYNSGTCSESFTRIITDEAPPVCTGATAAVTGSSGGTGLTQATPWILNAGDVISITPATGGIINGVVFTVTPVAPAGTALPAVSDNLSPFAYTWTDLTDNTVYRVVATITYAPGCTETVTRFVQDQVCSGGTVVATGSVGAGTGMTAVSPWVFNAADKVAVTAPTGATISNVQFNLYQGSTTTLVASSNDAATPFEMLWVDRTDNQVYRLEMTVTYAAGCSELITRWIQDQSLCFITALTPTVSTVDSGSRKIATITFTITNPTAEALTIDAAQVGWFRDAQHPEAILTNISFNGTSVDVTSQAPPSTGLITPLSPAPPVIPANGGSYTVAVIFDIGKKNEVDVLASNWISSLCLRYSAPSFGTAKASCNVLGSITGNPTSCN